jgi:SAM-dependent methyltransferase
VVLLVKGQPRFDALAPHYWWLERVTFGQLLHACRTALLGQIGSCTHALVIGDGDGRFLVDLLLANPTIRVDNLDVSPGMIAEARRRVAKVPGGLERTRFLVADARLHSLPGSRYDLIVTHFFLDCFPAAELGPLVAKLAAATLPGAYWLVGDFSWPRSNWARLAAGPALWLMYLFFGLVTRIPTRRLVDPAPEFVANGFKLNWEETRLAGFLVAGMWRRAQQRPDVE